MNITSTESCQANLQAAKLSISLTLIISGIVLNVSVVAALLRRKVASLSGFQLLVVHLASADLMVFITAAPFLSMSAEYQQHAFTTAVCKGTAFSNRFTTISSIFILTAMSGCRFYSITKPFSYRVHVKSSTINVACGFLWFLSLVLSVTPFLGWGEYEQIKGQCWCALNPAKHKLNYTTVLVLAFCLPTALCCYFLVGIVVAMRNSRKTVSQKSNQAKGEVVNVNLEPAEAEAVAVAETEKQQPGQPQSPENLEEEKSNSCKAKVNLDRCLKRHQGNVDSEKPVHVSILDVLPNIQQIIEPVMTSTPSAFVVRKSSFLARKSKQTFDIEKAGNGEPESRENVFELQSYTNDTDGTNQILSQHVKLAFENSKKLRENSKKAFSILILLFCVYIAFCGPTYIIWSWFAFSDSLGSEPPRASFPVFRTMAGAQSIANCLLYGIRHREIRKEVFKLWKDIALCAKAKILKFVHSIFRS
ncbi:probable G-protein coupled receptor No18 [Actinia tenebrosa]|uniref:Probable G-protein coupled receptor No18 n=1 Tax=Actinia tenebrosa TaxID=6105 RepID=A0A6P8I413_ACTTE|nr:probable G-protein coupled receptor No18 [Actinia tenebrosa]